MNAGDLIHEVELYSVATTRSAKGSGFATRTRTLIDTEVVALRQLSAFEATRANRHEPQGAWDMTMHYRDDFKAIDEVTGAGEASNPLGTRTARVTGVRGGAMDDFLTIELSTDDD